MADTAFQTQFRQEYVATFEDKQSRLRATCTTEAVIKGQKATFLVAGSGNASAVSRGVNGLIQGRANDLTQVTATLEEWHDKPQMTGFNLFASQGNLRRLMQENSVDVLNRKTDDTIIAELDTATVDTGSAVTADANLVSKCRAILGNAFVPIEEEDNMFGLITPAFEAYLLQIPEFSRADYVDVKPYSGPARRFRRWAGVNWIIHPRLTGVGTSSEKCYMYHRRAIGHAADTAGLQTFAGYDEQNDYSYARATMYMAGKLLQNSGVVQMLHNGSAYVGQ